MATQNAQFFSPWEPPPTFQQPPADAQLSERISLLAKFAAQNGAAFVEMVKIKQRDNPEYAFLFGGPGHAFYNWVLHCHLTNHPVDQPIANNASTDASAQGHPSTSGFYAPSGSAPVSAPLQVPAQGVVQQPQQLPAEVRDGFRQVLEALTGSKDSIKSSQQWFLACSPYASGMAAMMAERMLQLQDYEHQLHIIYLANDILFKR